MKSLFLFVIHKNRRHNITIDTHTALDGSYTVFYVYIKNVNPRKHIFFFGINECMRMVVQKKKKNVCVQEMMQNRN